jgi:DNA-binding MarR family transcriptional regulator
LSEFLGVTNGAVWQTARKLTRKGLIESYREPHNKKEVYFRLTDLGRKASDGHKQHHETINAEFADYAENHIGDNDLSAIMGFLKMVVKSTPGK